MNHYRISLLGRKIFSGGSLLVCLLFSVSFSTLQSQDIALYKLENNTLRGLDMNMAFIPDASFFFEVPVLSNIKLEGHSPFSVSELTKFIDEDKTYDLKALSEQSEQFTSDNNSLGFQVETTILNVGYVYGNDLYNFGAKVNNFAFFDGKLNSISNFLSQGLREENRPLDFKAPLISAASYIDFYLGYATELPEYNLKVGGRAKLLIGIARASSSMSSENIATIDPGVRQFDLSATQYKFTYTNIAQGGFNINGTGFGFDIGGSWHSKGILDHILPIPIGVNLSVTNLFAFISWDHEARQVISLDRGTYNFKGISSSFTTVNDIGDEFEKTKDEAKNAINYLGSDTTINIQLQETTSVPTRVFLSVDTYVYGTNRVGLIYHASITPDRFSNIHKIGLSYDVTTPGGVLAFSLVPSYAFVGDESYPTYAAALSVNAGTFQFYTGYESDQITSLVDMRNVNFHLGMNFFIFGDRTSEVSTPEAIDRSNPDLKLTYSD